MKKMRKGARVGAVGTMCTLLALCMGCEGGALSYESLDDLQGPPGTTNPPPDDGSKNNGTPDDPEDAPPIIIPEGPMAGRSPMRLLTRYEYDNTVSDLLGFPSTQAEAFPSENLADGFENNAWTHNTSPTLLRAYMTSAEALSKKISLQPPPALAPCVGEAPNASLCQVAIESFTSSAFRRPVHQEELDLFHALYREARELGGPQVALELTTQAILQSPQFLYRLELYEPTPKEFPALPPRDGGMEAERFELVGPYEMASRLSYFFWGTMPDEELLAVAERGDLNTPEVLEAQVERLLASPRAREMTLQFHRQWLGLDAFGSIVKDEQRFPAWEAEMREDLRLSLDAFIEHVYWEEGDFRAFMTSPAIFLTPALAALYGRPAPQGSGDLWKEDFPASERAGILTQPGLMALLSYPNQSSPIFRAIWVRERLLCQHLPPPPSDIQIDAPDPDPNMTTREVFAIHTANEACAECHLLIDPLGFGFEGYDALGRFREVENGIEVDTSGELIGSPDREMNGEFDDAVELANRLAGSGAIEQCMADQWFTFAMGRPHDDSDGPSMNVIYEGFSSGEGAYADLFKAIVLADSFRYRKKEAVAEAEFEEANPTLVEQQDEGGE